MEKSAQCARATERNGGERERRGCERREMKSIPAAGGKVDGSMREWGE